MRWFQKLPRPAQICIVVCLLFPFFFTVGLLAAKPNSQDFVDARRVVPEVLIKKVIAENYFSTNNTLSLKALKLEGEKPLYIFDLNTSELCGLRGCLYVGYVSDGTKVLDLYLKQLPKGIKLFSADGTQNHYPCVAVSQMDAKNRIVKKRYCSQGGKIVSVFQQLVEGGQ